MKNENDRDGKSQRLHGGFLSLDVQRGTSPTSVEPGIYLVRVANIEEVVIFEKKIELKVSDGGSGKRFLVEGVVDDGVRGQPLDSLMVARVLARLGVDDVAVLPSKLVGRGGELKLKVSS
jgi:hypothetical protein